MKKFKFNLSVVLETRRAKEKEALRAFALEQSSLQAALQHKAKLLDELESAFIRKSQLAQRPTVASAFMTEHDFIVGTKQRIVQADQAILRAHKRLQKASRDYLMARKESLAMENLRNRAFEEFKREVRKKEQRELDDLTVMRSRFGGGE